MLIVISVLAPVLCFPHSVTSVNDMGLHRDYVSASLQAAFCIREHYCTYERDEGSAMDNLFKFWISKSRHGHTYTGMTEYPRPSKHTSSCIPIYVSHQYSYLCLTALSRRRLNADIDVIAIGIASDDRLLYK